MARPLIRPARTHELSTLALTGGVPSPRGSQLMTAQHSQHSPRSRLSANISRPDEAHALANMLSKQKTTESVKEPPRMTLVRSVPKDEAGIEAKAKLLQTPLGETSIVKKEDALEQIMCAEALAGFERMARHQLDLKSATLATVDPDRADVDLEELTRFYLDDSDIMEPDSESDDEMIKMHDYQFYNAGPRDDPQYQTWGLRFGYGFSSSATAPQEKIFAANCAGFTLLGLINSHGSKGAGEALAQFVSVELPSAFFKSPWLTQENDVGTAISHAFDRTHRKAIKQLDCRLTGACVTVLLFDEDRIYVAHVGNCRAVLAIPDPNMNAEKYHHIPIAITEDHKLSVRSEFDRILECGGEVRRLMNDNVHRLFFKEDTVPALTLTRGIGHRMAHQIGVTHIPAIHVLHRGELHKDSFILLGSGGVWHAMSERGIVNWIGTHFADPRQAAESVTQECRRRWDDPSKRLKSFVHRGATESFGSVLVYPSLDVGGHDNPLLRDADRAIHPPRQFVLGPHKFRVAKREWKDVRQINWREDLAIIMAGGRPEREMFHE